MGHRAHPVESGQQPEASLASWQATVRAKRGNLPGVVDALGATEVEAAPARHGAHLELADPRAYPGASARRSAPPNAIRLAMLRSPVPSTGWHRSTRATCSGPTRRGTLRGEGGRASPGRPRGSRS